jgi:hypothetical protein
MAVPISRVGQVLRENIDDCSLFYLTEAAWVRALNLEQRRVFWRNCKAR